MLVLKLDKTSGLLRPGGLAPTIVRGPQNATLQFLNGDVAELLPDGADAIALKLYTLTDTTTPLATFDVWTKNTGFSCYIATLNPLVVASLGYLPACNLYGRFTYGSANVDTPLFHVNWGGTGEVGGTPIPPIVIIQPTGGPVNFVQDIGTFAGLLKVGQVVGGWKVKAACNVLGLTIDGQDAPTGANLLVDLVKGGAAQNKIGQLTAASTFEETIFGSPLTLAVGDVIKWKPTQVGSTKPGNTVTVKAIIQLLS